MLMFNDLCRTTEGGKKTVGQISFYVAANIKGKGANRFRPFVWRVGSVRRKIVTMETLINYESCAYQRIAKLVAQGYEYQPFNHEWVEKNGETFFEFLFLDKKGKPKYNFEKMLKDGEYNGTNPLFWNDDYEPAMAEMRQMTEQWKKQYPELYEEWKRKNPKYENR